MNSYHLCSTLRVHNLLLRSIGTLNWFAFVTCSCPFLFFTSVRSPVHNPTNNLYAFSNNCLKNVPRTYIRVYALSLSCIVVMTTIFIFNAIFHFEVQCQCYRVEPLAIDRVKFQYKHTQSKIRHTVKVESLENTVLTFISREMKSVIIRSEVV